MENEGNQNIQNELAVEGEVDKIYENWKLSYKC